MSQPRNVVVIGAGPAGYVCAIRLAQLGQKVTVIERSALGGTCLNVGCIPSKALIAAGALLHKVQNAQAMGITAKDVSLDVGQLVEWKQGIVGKLTGGVGGLLKNHGATVIYGTASITSKTSVEVTSSEGKQTLNCDDIVIATGSEPIEIPGFAFDEDNVWSSTGALRPDSIPKHLVVIGGGYIGLEMGMMYRRLGSEVTVLEASPRVLPGQDEDCVKIIQRSLKKSKTKVMTETFAKSWKKDAGGLVVTVEKNGKRLGLELNRGFVSTNKKMQTSIPNIYAVGDIAGQPMLAHKGSKEGLIAAAVIAGQNDEYDAKCVPAVIFTAPEMASVGLTVEQAEEQGLKTRVGQFPFAASGRAMSLMETEGFIKIVADAKTDEVLGVHMVGPEVTELIAEAALAIEMGATTEDIARTIHAHPTLPEVMMEAAESVHNMAVHIFQKK